MKTPCLECPFICDDDEACCAGPLLDIPLSEPESFRDELNNELNYPEECYFVEQMFDRMDEAVYRLGEDVGETGNRALQISYKMLSMQWSWLFKLLLSNVPKPWCSDD